MRILYILPLLVQLQLHAQNSKSLQENRIDELNHLLANSACVDDSLAKKHYEEISSMLDSVVYPMGKVTALKHYGTMMYCQGKLDSIIYYQRSAALIGEENGLFSFSGRMFCNLGYLTNNDGHYDSSYYYFNRALDQGILAEDSVLISVVYTGMGINARDQGFLDRSLEMYLNALRISESRLDSTGMITAKMNLLNFYRDHRPDLFVETDILEVLEMAKLVGLSQHVVSAYEYLGYFKADEGDLDQAFEYFSRGIDLNKKVRDNNRQISLLSGLSYAHRKSQDFRTALKWNNEAIANARSSNFLEYLPSLYAGNVENYISLEEYDKAVSDGERAIEVGEEFESVDQYYKTLQNVALAYNKLGRYSKAYQAQLKYTQLSEKRLNSEKTGQLAEMQTRYETEKKETEIASLSQQASIQALEIKQKNQAIIIGLVVILFILGMIYFIYKQRETKKLQSQTELEQRFLRSQLNPHFISNALVAVQSFMLKNDSESAALYLTKFSKLMREILENSRKEFVPVEEEISMLRNFLDIHKLRLGSFDFTIELADNIDPEVDTIPPMFVQPFLENAVEHGIGDLKEGGIIELKFRKEGDYISIEVNDNGRGLTSTSNMERKSLSSTIIKERMALFNKSLKRKIELVMDNLRGEKDEIEGTRIELKVPYSHI